MFKKTQQRILSFGPSLLALALGSATAGCVIDDPLPDLGLCADTYGQDIFEYGQVGIGTCLAGPTDIRIVPHPEDPDDFFLLVTNSNFEVNFAEGSLLAIPFSGIDRGKETNYLHEVGATALPVPEFPSASSLSTDGRYALVSDRQANKLMGEEIDRVYVADLQGLAEGQLSYAERGSMVDEEGRSYIPVPTDPHTVVTHPDSGLMYVLTLTSHQVTVLNEATTPIQVIDVVGSGSASEAVFEDRDGTGSYADYHLEDYSGLSAQDETWEISYREGEYRLYVALEGDEGTDLQRYGSPDMRSWQPAVAPDLLAPGEGAWSTGGYGRGSAVIRELDDELTILRLWVEGRDADGIPAIGATETVTNWSLDWDLGYLEAPVLEAHSDYAADGVAEPWALASGDAHWLAFTAHGSEGRSIGVAAAQAGESGWRIYSAPDAAALAPAGDGVWDGEEVYAPALVRWGLTDEDLLYYTGSDGSTTAIGLAVGEDGEGFERYGADPDAPGRIFGPGEVEAWDGAAVSHPAVFHDGGQFHMLYAGSDGVTWGLGHATSFDGVRWERDLANPVLAELGDGPPAVAALMAAATDTLRVEGSVSGNMAELPSAGDTVAVPGQMYVSAACPLRFTVVDRAVLGRGEGGDAWEDGSGAPALVAEDGGEYTLYYETIEDGTHLLGEASSDDGMTFDRTGAVQFDGEAAGELSSLDGAGGPAPLDVDGERWLVFHGWRGAAQAIYAAAGDSSPGATFAALNGGGAVLEPAGEGAWDGLTVSSPSLVEIDGQVWLYYEGSDGARAGIGAAVYDGESGVFQRVEGPYSGEAGLVLERGEPGDWDDAWVGSPHVFVGADGALEMVYAASDSGVVRIGRASSMDGLTWVRHEVDGAPAPVLGPDSMGFDSDGLHEPFVIDDGEQRRMWYEGLRVFVEEVPRVGAAVERDGEVWVKAYRPLTFDDTFVVTSEQGDTDPLSSIDLGDDSTLVIDGVLIHGSGVADMAVTPDGRFLLVSNKLYDNLYVIDAWDDTGGDFVDSNYHGIEAIIQVPNHYSVIGTRGMAFSEDGQTLYLLLAPLVRIDDPTGQRRYGAEAVLVIDLSRVEDGVEPVIYDDLVVGYAATARGVEEDVGNPTIISGGPTNIVLSPDQTLAYVAHYNDNSVHVYRLDMSRDPILVDVIDGLGEEPFDLTLSPDGLTLFVANYVGELEGPTQNVVHSTLSVIDLDPDSPTYHQVSTTLRNRDAW